MGGRSGFRGSAWAAPFMVAAALGGAGVAWADEPASDTAAAKSAAIKSLAAGDAAAACATLQPLLPTHPDDLVLHFLVGECLARTGQPRAAIAEYRYVLAHDPNAIRARASLASAEAAAGDDAAARRDVEAVLAHELPAAARAKLEALRANIPPRSHWSGVVTLGGMYDSNPGVGPWKNTVT